MFTPYLVVILLTVVLLLGIRTFSLFVTHVLDKPASDSWIVDIFDQ